MTELKEEFCGACLAIPLALAGGATATVGARGSHKKNKKILLWSGIIVTILSLLIMIYFVWIKKCDQCIA